MNAETEELTALLAAELADNEELSRSDVETAQAAPRYVDTRTIPARFHHLMAMGRSPAHGRASFAGSGDPDTLAKRLGSGTHAMLLGKPWIIYPGRRVKGKKNPSAWDTFAAQHADKVIMSTKEHAQAKAMCEAIRSHEIANRLLFSPGVVHEQTIWWEQNGRKRRSTPDARGRIHVVEVKTARSVERERFCRDAGYRGYHAQLADQSAAIEALTGAKPREVYVVAVESTWPHVVAVFQATNTALELGANLCRDWLDRLVRAEATGHWPGYSEKVEPLDIWNPIDFDEPGDEDPFKESA